MPVFTEEVVNQLLGIDDAFKAPTKLMQILMDKPQREGLFRQFLAISTDVSFDWFHEYFEDEQAQRKTKKQGFTPEAVAKILAGLTTGSQSNCDIAAGTGGITIAKWWSDCLAVPFWKHCPSDYFYYCEELSDRAVPFLLFNLAIRGMNAYVIHGDSLSREIKQIYFIQNDHDDFLQFSSINVMPHSDVVAKEFEVNKWTAPVIEHIESTELSGPVANMILLMIGGKRVK